MLPLAIRNINIRKFCNPDQIGKHKKTHKEAKCDKPERSLSNITLESKPEVNSIVHLLTNKVRRRISIEAEIMEIEPENHVYLDEAKES